MLLIAIGGLALALFHRRGFIDGFDDAEIMLGVLQVVFRENAVAGRERIFRERLILLMYLEGIAAYADVGTVAIENLVPQRHCRARTVLMLVVPAVTAVAAMAPMAAMTTVTVRMRMTATTAP